VGLNATGIFSRHELQLEPIDDGRFDVIVRADEKNGLNLMSWLRGLPHKTVHPEIFNVQGRAINVRSLLRWDESRRRAWVGVSLPMVRNPKWRYALEFDAREEQWGTQSFRKGELKLAVQSLVNDRWKWRSGLTLMQQDLTGLKYVGGLERKLLHIPERRFNLHSSWAIEAGRMFGSSARFLKLEGSGLARWFPQARGDDYEVMLRIRAGKGMGQMPLDELFTVGLDRDRDVWLRAHPASREEAYVVANWDVQKKVYQGPFFKVSAGPFLDNGWISSEPYPVWDAGLQLGFKISDDIALNLSYGWNFRTKKGMALTRN
jgi:hypothetical protein